MQSTGICANVGLCLFVRGSGPFRDRGQHLDPHLVQLVLYNFKNMSDNPVNIGLSLLEEEVVPFMDKEQQLDSTIVGLLSSRDIILSEL